MNKLLCIIVLFLLPIFILAQEFTGTVIQVCDGDTVWIKDTSGKEIKIRMFGIDAPEKKQTYGPEAKTALSNYILNKNVVVKVNTIDMYGRSVSTIYVNELNINEEMVKTGNAWWYKAYDRKDKNMELFEKTAKDAKIGLWNIEKPQEPWQYRREQKANTQIK